MRAYVVQRILLAVPTLFVVTLLTFSLVRLMPGDVVMRQLSESPNFKQEDVEALRHDLGIDKPWPSQYVKWMGGVVRGDFGKSLWQQKSVTSIILGRLVPTIELACLAFVIGNAIAMLFGVISAARQDSALDYGLRLLSIGGLSVPNFWLGTLVIVFGAKWFHYLPPLTYVSFTDDPIQNLKQFVLPAMVISVSTSSSIMRMMRSSMLEVMRQDYIRTAWSKGLNERSVIFVHALKNAMLPVITLQGFQLALLLSGTVVIELLFGIPGVGRMLFDAVNNRDYTVLQGAILFFALMIVVINLLVDLAYGWFDPRVKY